MLIFPVHCETLCDMVKKTHFMFKIQPHEAGIWINGISLCGYQV